jgi:hypothetical protein
MMNRKLDWALVAVCLVVPAAAHSHAAEPAASLDIRSKDGQVLIAANDIRSYDWTTHTLTLEPKVREALHDRLLHEATLVAGVPFAVAIAGKTIYTGTFTSGFSSFQFATPVILSDGQGVDAKLASDQLRIELGYPTAKYFKGDDPRGDQRIREALKAAGKLRE